MARHHRRLPATAQRRLGAAAHALRALGGPLWVAYHSRRTVATLDDVVRLTLQVRRCLSSRRAAYHRPYRPEEERAWPCPTASSAWTSSPWSARCATREHRSVPGDPPAAAGAWPGHRRAHGHAPAGPLRRAARRPWPTSPAAGACWPPRGGSSWPSTGCSPTSATRCCGSCATACPARSCWPAACCGREADLAALLRGAGGPGGVPVPIAGRGLRRPALHPQRGGQRPAGRAPPAVPLPLPAEAARPIYEADRHAKKVLKKKVRGVRPLERALEGRRRPGPPETRGAAVRGYCLAVRSALTDDGRPPLDAAGLRLHERLTAIRASLGAGAGRGTGGGSLPRELSPARPPAGPRPGGDRRAVAAHRGRLRLGAPGGAPPGQRRGQGRGAVRAAYARAAGGDARRRREDGGLPGAGRRPLPAGHRQLRPGAVPLLPVDGLPPTDNDLEHVFGAARHHERRTTGRKVASPALVAARRGARRGRGGHPAAPAALRRVRPPTARPAALARWRQLRGELAFRHEARRAQLRFRRAPPPTSPRWKTGCSSQVYRPRKNRPERRISR